MTDDRVRPGGAWMSDSAAVAWYPIRWLTPRFENRTVHLAGEGFEIVGRLSRQPPSLRWAWYEWRPAAGAYSLLTPYRVWRADTVPTGREPVVWRPVEWEIWPDPLPEPVTGARYVPPEAVPDAEPPPLPETDDWPYPGLKLGERVPPLTEAEAEARVLRGLRRMDMEPRVGLRAMQLASDIPREFYYLMRRHQLAEDMAEARRRGMPVSSEIGDVRAAWTPSRRDHGDWPYALDWWRQLATFERQLFRYRAANPPFSWRQIGEREGMSQEGARKAYGRAVARVFVIGERTAPDIGNRIGERAS